MLKSSRPFERGDAVSNCAVGPFPRRGSKESRPSTAWLPLGEESKSIAPYSADAPWIAPAEASPFTAILMKFGSRRRAFLAARGAFDSVSGCLPDHPLVRFADPSGCGHTSNSVAQSPSLRNSRPTRVADDLAVPRLVKRGGRTSRSYGRLWPQRPRREVCGPGRGGTRSRRLGYRALAGRSATRWTVPRRRTPRQFRPVGGFAIHQGYVSQIKPPSTTSGYSSARASSAGIRAIVSTIGSNRRGCGGRAVGSHGGLRIVLRSG